MANVKRAYLGIEEICFDLLYPSILRWFWRAARLRLILTG
jgi:hypothetical protein